MAAPVFGATVAQLQASFFGGKGIVGTGSSRGETMAGEVIEEIAGDVARALRAVQVEPDQITVGAAPDAYDWCQKTILYGAAAEFSRRCAREEVALAEGWDTKYADRLRELAREPRIALGDLAAFRESGHVRQVWT